MSGKWVVVTGATSGIGKEAARELARQGAHLGIVGRNAAKTSATADELRRDAGAGAEVETFIADLSELSQVRSLAAELHERWDRIDVLINNAGVNNAEPQPTSDGFDAMLATNYLAPFLLTNLVLDLLRAGAQHSPELSPQSPARVVNVASEAHRLSDRLDPDTLTDFSPSGALQSNRLYGRSKLALILFTQELATRVEGDGIIANSVCPGLVATNLVGADSPATRFAKAASSTLLVRRPEQGARVLIRLASDPAFAHATGKFVSSTPGAGLLPPHPKRRDKELQHRLWTKTEALVGLH
jgi:NAD(P)-dependent dehydrogenase (short-subunit alcohol dehydrogenase family)